MPFPSCAANFPHSVMESKLVPSVFASVFGVHADGASCQRERASACHPVVFFVRQRWEPVGRPPRGI